VTDNSIKNNRDRLAAYTSPYLNAKSSTKPPYSTNPKTNTDLNANMLLVFFCSV